MLTENYCIFITNIKERLGKKRKKKLSKKVKKGVNNSKLAGILNSKLFLVISILGGGLTLLSIFTDVFKPTYRMLFPESFHRDVMDNNIHGKFLKGLQGANKDSLMFVIRSSEARYYITEFYDETYACWWPNKRIKLFLHEECPLQYRIDDTGQVLFSGNISGYDNETILMLVDNELVLDDSNIFSWNGDDYGFEIVDKNNKVLFSIDYVPPNKIYIQGIFNDKVRHVGIVDKTIVIIPYEEPERLLRSRDSIVRLFEYTGDDWKSKRVK